MSASKLTVLSAGGLAALLAAGAWAAPVAVPPGASDVAIPTFSGSTPTVDMLGGTGLQTVTKQGVTVNFEELAVETSLDPGHVTIAFEIFASNTPTSLGATLHGFGGFTLSAESCTPLFSATSSCGSSTGTVSRSPGHGENLMFASLGTTSITPPGGMPVNASNVYGIFSNATGFTKAPVQVTDDGKTFSFTGFGLSSKVSAPEPATFGLLSLGLLGTLLARRRPRRAV